MPELRTKPAGRLTKVLYVSSIPLATLLAAAGCVTAPTSAAPSSTAAVFASPVPSPSPFASTLATPLTATGVSPSGGAATAPAPPPATVDVSPAQVATGAVTLSMSLEPARHMLPQTAVMTSDPDPAHQTSAGDPAPASTALVLDGLLSLTNNLDPSQPAPADQPQAMIRHLNLQVRTNEGETPVPYLAVSIDLLLDGHPIASGLPVKPMVAAESTTPQLYYGNNLKLTERGTYQVFIRLQPSALLGKDQPQPAQFNMVVR